jgi:hypothetical protein
MQNSFTQLSPINKIFKCFLLFPYPASERKKDLWLKVYLIFPACLTIFAIVFGFFIKPMYTAAVITVWVAYVVFCGVFIMFLLGVYGAYFNIKDQKMFFDVLDCIDEEFFIKFSTIISYRKFLIKALLKFIIYLILMVTFKIIILTLGGANLMYYSYLFIPSLLNQIKCFQISFYLNIMNEKLTLLNEILQRLPENLVVLGSRKLSCRQNAGKTFWLENLSDLKRIYG